MRRRAVLAVLGGAASMAPLRVRAQSRSMPLVGYLSASASETGMPFLDHFRDDLKAGGYVEGRNVALEVRWAEGLYERLPAMAAELVALKVAVIVALGGPAIRAAQRATAQIPIVFQIGGDPVALGMVASLGRPGGNATGIDLNLAALTPKRLELLRELMPGLATVAFLHNPDAPAAGSQLTDVQSAARDMGLALQVEAARAADDIELAFARLATRQPQALLVASDVLFSARRAQLAALAARYAIPAVHEHAAFVVDGGLISYGPNLREAIRPLGLYTGKILSGAKPAELPVQQPTKFELAINLKTAKALGLTVPTTLLDRADQVIE